VNQGMFPGMGGMGGGLALNQLLVTMDGVDNPPFFRRVITSKVNSVWTRSTSCRAGSQNWGRALATVLALAGSFLLFENLMRLAGGSPLTNALTSGPPTGACSMSGSPC